MLSPIDRCFRADGDRIPPAVLRVPTFAGGIYMKASGFKTLTPRTNPHKHLQDAAPLLAVARQEQLVGHGPAMAKRLIWLNEALRDSGSIAWEYVTLADRNDAIRRLARAIHDDRR